MMNDSAVPGAAGPLLTILLIADSVREDWRSEPHQDELQHVERALQVAGGRLLSQIGMQESGGLVSVGFAIGVRNLSDYNIAVIKSWMQVRFGRKVRIKASDIDHETSIPDEAEQLLNVIKDFSIGYDEIV